MEHVIVVETVGPIKPPMAVHAMSPEEAAKGYSTVTMVFDKKVVLTIEHGKRIDYSAGVHEVPDYLADHWYLEANNVRLYNRPHAMPRAVEPKDTRPAGKGAKTK